MLVSDLVFEVRNASLARVGLLTPDDGLTTFKATLRLNNVGSWEITIPENRPLADVLRAPGAGLIVTGPNGVIISGPTVAATKTNESGSPVGSWLIRGADDSVVLGERLAYPTPSTADVTAQTSAYDAVSSVKASTAMLGYVTRNIGSSAPAARKISTLTTVADPVVGSNISYAARFDVLGQVLTDIAGVDGLAFDMYQSGSNILFAVWAPTDKSKTIRLDVANNTLQKSAYGYGYGVSRAIVAGQGVGTARVFTEVTTSLSLQTESSFGRRVERFVDQRDEADSAKLVTSGQATLADAGGLITSVDVVPSNDTTMRPLVDFNLGDKVSVVIASQEVAAVITQMSLSITDVGVYVGITVGNPVGVDFEAITAKRQTDATSNVASLAAREQVLPAGSITGSQLANGSITNAKLSEIVSTNLVLNGGMDVWQRGANIATATGVTNGYGADRWQLYRSGYVGGATTYQAAAGLTGFQYCARIQRDSGNTNTTTIYLSQAFESRNSIPYQGQTLTLSFWARAGANFSASGGVLSVNIVSGTGTDQNIGNPFTGSASVAGVSAVLTTSWQRFVVTGTVPTNATQLGVGYAFNPVGTAGAADYFETTGIQVEVGSAATSFRRQTPTYETELLACQRYFNTGSLGGTYFIGSSAGNFPTPFADAFAPMRVVPTVGSIVFTNNDNASKIGFYTNSNRQTTLGVAAANTAYPYFNFYCTYTLSAEL